MHLVLILHTHNQSRLSTITSVGSTLENEDDGEEKGEGKV